jgi:hypothetical protein
MLPCCRRPGHAVWRMILLVMVVAMGLVVLLGCDDSDSDSLTPPPATIISASESPTAGAPQVATSAASQPAQAAPTPAAEDYPYPEKVATTPTPWVYPTQ